MALNEVVGWIGSVLILLSYFLLSSGKLSGTSRIYQGMNLVGAICVGMNAYSQSARPIVFIEIVWGGIALATLIRLYRGRRSA